MAPGREGKRPRKAMLEQQNAAGGVAPAEDFHARLISAR